MADMELPDANALVLTQADREKVDIDTLADEKLPNGRIKIAFSVEGEFWVPGMLIASSLLLLWKMWSGV